MRNLYDEGKGGCFTKVKGLKKQLRSCFILLTTLTATQFAAAQLVVTQNASAQSLAQTLAGQGVTISNATRTGNINSSGTFIATGTNLGLSSGVILSTGNVAHLPQAANAFASTSYSGNGDAQLQQLTGGNIYDKTVLEFDVVPQGNLLMFNYVFASEEYPEWVCTQFNDVFGFFISGPKPNGGNYASQNIALIPGTNLPVAINTINRGLSGVYGNPANCQSLAYSSLHINNLLAPVNPHIVYDGMTVVLTAVAVVSPCETYHLKLAVADVSDRIYDSGVFLQENSVVSVPVTITSSTELDYAGYNSSYEGCVGGKFTFSVPTPQPADVHVNIQITGSAINGVDYNSIPSVVTIPAGMLSTDINIMPIEDGIAEGEEDIIISTVNPCTGLPLSSAMMTIRDNPPANITTNQNIICNGQNAQMFASGGLGYTWTPATGLNDANIADPIAAPPVTTTYTVTMNWGSCTKTATKTIIVGGSNISLIADPSLTSCNGGPVQLSVNGAGNYNWSNGSSASTINITSTGNYVVTATDAAGCTASASANVVISNLNISNPLVSPSCGGANNGSIGITVTGMGTPFTYQWSNAATSQNISNLAAGSYDVTVSNTDGCSVTQSYMVALANGSINIQPSVTNVSCNGGNNGSINLNVSGGNAPYSFVWNNGNQTQNLAGLNAGTYDVIVSDAIGCMASQSILVSENFGININTSKTDVTCNGGNNGTIAVSVTGGDGNYIFVWNDGNNNANRTNLTAGNYILTVTDGNGCFAVSSTAIAQPAAISITMNTTGTDCASPTGAVSTTVHNGTIPYSFNWSHDGSVHTSAVNGLAPGNISVSVSDANGCTASQSAVVGVAANNMNADFTYSGNYCEANATVNFTHNGSTGNINHYWSFGGNNAAVSANPSFTFATAGNYNVVHIVTADYCSDTVVKAISISPNPSVTAAVNNVTCNQTNNGSIQLNVTTGTAPFQYNWNDGATSANRANLIAGNYSVVVTDQNSCSTSFAAVVAQTAGLNLTSNHSNVSCYGSADANINLTVGGGTAPYTFNWSNGVSTQNLTNLGGGTYTVNVLDVNNCSASKTIVITEPSAIVINAVKNDVTCYGQNTGSIAVTVSGGTGNYQFNWSNSAASQNVSSLPAGYYSLTVTDGNLCNSISNFTIDQPVAITTNITKHAPLCNGINDGSIDVTASGGTQPYQFAWSNGGTTSAISNLAPGTYVATITDNAGCSIQTSVSLAQTSALVILQSQTTIGCGNNTKGSINVTVSGGLPSYLYQWNTGDVTSSVNNLSAGNYSVTVTDANGCKAESGNIVIAQNPPITITTQVTDVACAGMNNGKVIATVSGGNAPYIFHWNNGSTAPSLSNLTAGNYSVSVIDSKGCNANASAAVQQGSSLQVTAAITQPICSAPKGAIDLTVQNGTAPFTFQWSNGATSEDLNHLSAGIYTVVVRDANQCPFDTVIEILNPATFSITASGSTEIQLGESAQLHVSATANDVIYNWLPSSGISCASCANVTVAPTQTTEYTVVGTDANGCTAQDKVTVEVSAETNIFLPNAFSPNGDGNNDVLELYGNLNGIKYFQLLVFDRWGEKVFETNDQYFNWDGTYRGARQDAAVYIYVMKIVYLNGKTDRTYKGSITILQ